MTETRRLLIIDDEAVMRESLAAWLAEDGHVVDTAPSGESGMRLLDKAEYAVCFVDLKMPGGMDGIATMRAIKTRQPHAAVVIITAFATVDTAVMAMREGAEDYVVKPCNLHQISALVERVFKCQRLERENALLRQKLTLRYRFHDIGSKSPRMAQVFDLVRDVAPLRTTVLVQGDSGTGKEMIARAVHQEGSRRDAPFVAVPCAALSEDLLESELFGYERGAFTGAVSQRKGKVELAHTGTLFLDEIGDISARLQKDLLRFLQERTFFRVGGTEEHTVDVRVITATHRDLRAEVEAGRFRQDLFYRLNVVNIRLPPLRERLEDVPLLARHFLGRASTEIGKDVSDIDDAGIRALMMHNWPGNVRKLENAVERAIVSARNPVLTAQDFAFLAEHPGHSVEWAPPGNTTLAELERRAIVATLERTAGNVSRAAEVLGIDRSTLYDKLKRHGIDRDQP